MREVVLATRPQGEPKESDFELREVDAREPGDGEVLVRNVFVSVDPYMRGRMTGIRTYVDGFDVGEAIVGGAVGRVVASRHEGLSEGDWVSSMLGWRDGGIVEGSTLRKLDPRVAPPSTALGALGMPGFTAWIGLEDVGQVKDGETIYVSGAAGAVGSAAVQIAKRKGLRVIGSAGSEEKVEWLRSLGIGGVQLPRDARARGPRRRDRRVLRQRRRRPARGRADCAASVRARDRVRRRSHATTTRSRSPARATWRSSSPSACACRASSSPTTPTGSATSCAEVGPWVARRHVRGARDGDRGARERARCVRRPLPRRQHRQDARPRRAGRLGPLERAHRRAEQQPAADLEAACADVRALARVSPSSTTRALRRAPAGHACRRARSSRPTSPSGAASGGARRRRSRTRRSSPGRSCRRSAGSRSSRATAAGDRRDATGAASRDRRRVRARRPGCPTNS